jgi:hypothetical protein
MIKSSIDLPLSPESTLKKEVNRLSDLIEQHEARWNKICAILDADPASPNRVIGKIRLLAAGANDDEDTTPPEVVEARKYFPAITDLHTKIDAAMVYEFERLNRHISQLSSDDVLHLANHLSTGMIEKANKKRYGVAAFFRRLFTSPA